jgi:hypothetical protein
MKTKTKKEMEEMPKDNSQHKTKDKQILSGKVPALCDCADKSQFNLSEKEDFNSDVGDFYHPSDVKEFIRRLKKELSHHNWYDWQIEGLINSLAGDKLT